MKALRDEMTAATSNGSEKSINMKTDKVDVIKQ